MGVVHLRRSTCHTIGGRGDQVPRSGPFSVRDASQIVRDGCCEDCIGTDPPRVRTEVIYVDLRKKKGFFGLDPPRRGSGLVGYKLIGVQRCVDGCVSGQVWGYAQKWRSRSDSDTERCSTGVPLRALDTFSLKSRPC